jgi:redox-sensitive bicupin YhaK (pirin superfamily)
MTTIELINNEILKAPRTRIIQRQGPFTLHFNFPGFNLPEPIDHGYGPLALIVESTLEPGTHIRLHEHTNDEIISWVPGGVMRHNDLTVGELVVDDRHLMVMNAGSGFWHEERVLPSDPYLRMLQIFVRPHAADLKPRIQFGEMPTSRPNEWRYLFGPENSDAPFFVRNDVKLHDIRLSKGEGTELPASPDGWDSYFYVFTGQALVDGIQFGEAETGLIRQPRQRVVTALEDTVIVCFSINPNAPVVRLGTVGR